MRLGSYGSDLVQIAAEGLAPKSQYQVYLAESDHAPFGKLEPLAVLKTNPDGGGIVQAIGPLKTLASSTGPSSAWSAVAQIFDRYRTQRPIEGCNSLLCESRTVLLDD